MKGSSKMSNHHFISYSVADASDFAIRLCDKLIAGPPEISAWLDKREIKPGQDWDDQIVKAIRTCDSLIFIMTQDSVESESGCKNEWSRAMKYKKPITPILLHEHAEIPFQLENRQYIDFTGNFETGLAQLRNHIQWLDTSEGKLQAFKDRLRDARRDLRRTQDPVKQERIQADIEVLNQQIADQEQIVEDPEAANNRVEERIATGIERERQPKKPVSGVNKTKFINPPPLVAPTYFQDRFHETNLVGIFLENDVDRLITIVGRAGVGKTAMVCRLLKSIEGGRLPENGENHAGCKKFKVDGIVYLSERGSRKPNFPDIFYDLCRLLPDDLARNMDSVYRDTTISTSDKMNALLRVFSEGRFIVLLDNFEDKVDTETLTIKDDDVREALTALLTSAPHSVKMIITTRIAPKKLALVEPAKQRRLDLDEGLGSPYAENILREMDIDGKVGLKEASNELLDEARRRTNGFPRALEALFAILSSDRETSLEEVLADAENLLPEHVVKKMVGEAYSRLDSDAQMVMQALAIYGRPVSNVAVDYLLQPFMEGIDSAKVLKRLVNMQFVRKEATNYYLHPVDREYALSSIPKGVPDDRFLSDHLTETEVEARSVFSQHALLARGAQFFEETRLPREDWKSLDDLAPQLAEFELRFQSDDYDTALGVILDIDFDYLMMWGHSRIVLEYLKRLQGKIEDDLLKKDSLITLGVCYRNLGDYQKAIDHHQQSLDIAREIGDRQDEGNALGNIGNCYSSLGDYQKAIEHYQRSLDIAREIGDRRGEGISLGNIGACYSSLGDYQKAINHHQQYLDIAREIGYRQGEGNALGNIGICYDSLGDYQKAIDHHQQSLDIAREIGDRNGQGNSLNNLACALLLLGDTDLAQAHLKTAAEIWEETGSPDVVKAYVVLSISLLKSGQYQQSKTNLEKARRQANIFFEKANRLETIDLKALVLCGLTVCERDKNYADKAREAFAQARAITKAKGQVNRVLKFFDLIAESDKRGLLAGLREAAGGIE
jgi:tetratricopeptide (TPR) repeat protein